MKKILQISNFVTLFFVIGVNYFINALQDGNTSIEEISDRYSNILTPADYAFSIWGLIYLALIAFAVYQLLDIFLINIKNDFVLNIGWWFVLANLANAAWVIAFSNDLVGLSLMLITVLFFSLLKITLNLNMGRWNEPMPVTVFVWWPISIYFGWVTVALIANISSYLTSLGWNGAPLSPTVWAILVLAVAAVVFVAMIWGRNMRWYALAGIWGIAAIGVKNWGSFPLVSYVSITVAIIIFINLTVKIYKNRASFLFQKKIKETN